LRSTNLEQSLEATAPRSIKKLLLPLFLQVGTRRQSLRADSAGFWHVGEDRYWLPRTRLPWRQRNWRRDHPAGDFCGLHGERTAGVHAVVDLFARPRSRSLDGPGLPHHIYPLCNPTGYEDGTRYSRSGAT